MKNLKLIIEKNIKLKFALFIIGRLFWPLLCFGIAFYNIYLGKDIVGLLWLVLGYLCTIEQQIKDLSKRIK